MTPLAGSPQQISAHCFLAHNNTRVPIGYGPLYEI